MTTRAHLVFDEVERHAANPAPLVHPIDEETPQIGLLVGIEGDHHEASRYVIGVDPSKPGCGVAIGRCRRDKRLR